MLAIAVERRIQRSVLVVSGLMTLVVTPWLNLDPINLPKFLALLVYSIFVAGILIGSFRYLLDARFRWVIFGFLSFLVASLIAFLGNGFGEEQLFGVFGRNTGLFAYLGLSIVLLGTVVVGRREFGRKILFALIAVSGFNLFYGLVQNAGADPIKWSNPYDPIVGTLGNPNFTSALLGMGATAVFAWMLDAIATRLRIGLAALMVGMLYISYESDAVQGIGVFLVGAVIVFYFRFVRETNLLARGSYLTLVGIGFVFATLGILQRGPLQSILYQESVTYRGDYWRAGWRMTLENPLFGVGMDGYGDWYRASRTEAAALRRGPDVTSNSAHNVFLDISSNGGFPLLIAYLFILGLALRASIRVLRRSKSYDFVGVGLVSCWIGYLVQSTISINQLGLAIWGWVLSGAIIGYEIYGDEEPPKPKQGQRQMIPPRAVITGSLGLVIGIALAIGPMLQDASFRNALEKSDGLEIKNAALQWPRSVYYMDYAADILLQNEVNDFALELSRESVKSNPRNFNGWKLLFNNPTATPAEKDEALKKMRELDPYNNTLPDR